MEYIQMNHNDQTKEVEQAIQRMNENSIQERDRLEAYRYRLEAIIIDIEKKLKSSQWIKNMNTWRAVQS